MLLIKWVNAMQNNHRTREHMTALNGEVGRESNQPQRARQNAHPVSKRMSPFRRAKKPNLPGRVLGKARVVKHVPLSSISNEIPELSKQATAARTEALKTTVETESSSHTAVVVIV